MRGEELREAPDPLRVPLDSSPGEEEGVQGRGEDKVIGVKKWDAQDGGRRSGSPRCKRHVWAGLPDGPGRGRALFQVNS